jgi:hypothetical protein
MNGSTEDRFVRDEQELEGILRKMQLDLYPKSINIEAPNGDILTIAIGTEFGFVQYENAASASPNYSIAVDKKRVGVENRFRDVDAGGTPTPIPDYACLPSEQIVEIVLYYARHLEIPNGVDWKQARSSF